MIPFLKQVAGIYAANERDRLIDYCFVFPNKRSATFFRHFMAEELDGAAFLPEVTDISAFVASFSDLTEAGRYDMLFTLFDCYRRLPEYTGEVEFDHFLFWADMLINDFNDVDRYLVDADALFENVKRLREISANYLTPEQLDVIRRFWGEDRTMEPVDRFWNHIDKDPDSEQHRKFVRLWALLKPLYHSYINELARMGLTTPGRLYRNAVEQIKERDIDELAYRRYVFVGFNVLSTSEIEIFRTFQKRGIGDYYWDFDTTRFNIRNSRAARFISRNIKEFRSRYELPDPEITEKPHINIVGTPSTVAQVKISGAQLEDWVTDKAISDPANAIDTAIVLPDENLFVTMIHSVPEVISDINVTMGIPMRITPVSALISNIVSLQMRSRMRNGQRIYFYEDVRRLLASPLVRKIDPEGCERIETDIRQHRLFSVSAEFIMERAPHLEAVFTPIADMNDHVRVYEYLKEVLALLDSKLDDGEAMQKRFVNAYRNSIEELSHAAAEFDVKMDSASYFRLIERAVNSETVNFTGTPLKGLQIMGVLETRALDFRNVIMLSMNERIFPSRHYTRSFIPDALRHGFGMATIDFQESIFAYYFYRLISRAENITLVYDAHSVGGLKSNEMSRYLVQLLYFHRTENVHHSLRSYSIQQFETNPIRIKKTPEIMEKLRQYAVAGSGKNLSASQLNTYLNCPLDFYLRFVEGYGEEKEITDFMDYSTYGNVLHKIAQRIYEGFQDKEHHPVVITADMLRHLARKDNPTLDRYIVETINKEYNKLPDDKLLTSPLLGECLVMGKVIRALFESMLEHDAGSLFTFIRAEMKLEGRLKITDDLSVNSIAFVDRVDEINGEMRFIDYKTGGDKLTANSINDLFNKTNEDRNKAVFQLMFYCLLYRSLTGDTRRIKPLIYKLSEIVARDVESVRIDGQEVSDYNDYYEEFHALLNELVLEIFNPKIDFVQSPGEHACRYCSFKSICGRQETKKY